MHFGLLSTHKTDFSENSALLCACIHEGSSFLFDVIFCDVCLCELISYSNSGYMAELKIVLVLNFLAGLLTCVLRNVRLLSHSTWCYFDERRQMAFRCVLLALFSTVIFRTRLDYQSPPHAAPLLLLSHSGNVPFPFFFRLLIGQRVLMLRNYMATI